MKRAKKNQERELTQDSCMPVLRILKNPIVVGFFLLVCLIGASAVSLTVGSSDLGSREIFNLFFCDTADKSTELIFWKIRLPRLAVALITGTSLALSGATMQSLLRNPLADTSIMGVSSGAALGAVLAIAILPASALSLQLGAITLGVVATMLVCALSKTGKVLEFLLAGIAVNALCGALVGFLLYSSRETGLRSYIFWALGSLDNTDWRGISTAATIAVPMWILTFFSARALNAMHLGREQAQNMGVSVNALWAICILSGTLMTAAAVSISGIIGFVGLVVPHSMRLWIGADNKYLLPISAISGALLMVCADLIARAINPVDPVPIGVITALLGVPFFVFLLKFGKAREC